jgi:hypothetical protein
MEDSVFISTEIVITVCYLVPGNEAVIGGDLPERRADMADPSLSPDCVGEWAKIFCRTLLCLGDLQGVVV